MNKVINFRDKHIESLKQEVMGKAVSDDIKTTLFKLLDLCAGKKIDAANEADNSSCKELD